MPPPTATSTLKKPPKWSWIILGCAVAACLIVILVATCSDSRSAKKNGKADSLVPLFGLERVKSLPKSDAPPVNFKEGQLSIELTLSDAQWSPQVITPIVSGKITNWRIHTPPQTPFYIWFWGDKDPYLVENEKDKEVKHWDMHLSIFRLLAKDGAHPATVNVSFRDQE